MHLAKKNENDGADNNPPPATITDIDGNIYHIIKIGNQYWLLENLKTTKFRDRTPIQNVTDKYMANSYYTSVLQL